MAGILAWVPPVLGTVLYVWGGSPFLTGAVDRAAIAPSGHDAAHRAGHHGGVRRELGSNPRAAEPHARVLVGTRTPRRDHAARPLARDAFTRPDHQRPRLAGSAAARRRGGRPGRGRGAGAARPSWWWATWCWCVLVQRCPRTDGSWPATAEMDESMVTGESRTVSRGPGDSGDRRHGVDRLRHPGGGDGDRRGHRACRHPAAGRRSPELHVPGAAPCRSGSGLAVLVRPGVGRRDRRRVVVARPARPGRGADHHRAGDRLPPRTRTGDPAGGGDLDRTCCPRRRPREGSPRPRAHADRSRPSCSTRPARSRRASRRSPRWSRRRPQGCRRTRCWPSPPRSRRTASTRWPGRSSTQPTSDSLLLPAATGFRSEPALGVTAQVDGRRGAGGRAAPSCRTRSGRTGPATTRARPGST